MAPPLLSTSCETPDSGSPALEDLLDHFDHVARLVGMEHVGRGSDVDFEGLDPRTGRPLSAYQLRGLELPIRIFQLADVELALGRNFMRALANIWTDQPWWPPNDPPRRDPFCPAPMRAAPPEVVPESE